MAVTWDDDAQLEGYTVETLTGSGNYHIEQRFHVALGEGDTIEDAVAAGPAIGDVHATLTNLEVSSVHGNSEGRSDQACWVTVTYDPAPDYERKNAYGEIWDWNLATAQVHITKALSQVHYSYDSVPKHIGSVIGVEGANVNGCDIYSPAMSLTITKDWLRSAEASMPGGSVNGLRDYITQCLAKVDNGFPSAGKTALFVGAKLGRTERYRWRVEAEFLIVDNPGNVVVAMWNEEGGGAEANVTLTGVVGWDYVWFSPIQKAITAGVMQNVIESGHVAKVYDTTSIGFDTMLGLSGSY